MRLARAVSALLATGFATAGAAEPALPEVLLSRQLLAARGLRPGDEVLLSASPDGSGPRRFRVAAAYEPVPDPARLGQPRHEVRLHLDDLAALEAEAGPGGDDAALDAVEAIHLRLDDPARADAVERRLEERLPGVYAARPSGTSESLFRVLERFHLAVAAVTVLASSAFLLALLVLRAEERRELAGVLRLLGVPRRRILLQSLLEGLVVASLGAVAGVLLARALEGAVNAFFQWRYDTALVFVRVSARVAAQAVLLAVPLGAAAGAAASWALLARPPLELLRR